MTTQAVVPTNGAGALAGLSDEERSLFGLDALDRSDQLLPRVRLAQPTSRLGEADPGEFHNNLTGTHLRVLNFVVLRVQKGRIMWPDGYQADQEPLCASDDARAPRDQFGGVYDHGQGCAACPMGQWGENNEAPACSLTYNYLAVDLATGLPFTMSLYRTNAKSARQLNTLFQAYTVTHAIRAVSEKVSNDKGVWYEWRFNDAGAVEDSAQFVAMARGLAGRALTTDVGDDPEMPEGGALDDWDEREAPPQEKDEIPF